MLCKRRLNSCASISSTGRRMTMQFAQQYVQVGTIVRLQATLKTDSPVNLVLPYTGDAPKDFQISVTDATGNAVPLTSWGRHLLDKPKPGELQSITMSFQRSLEVGNSVTYQFVLSRQFDMSNAGVYHVTQTRPGVYTPDGKLCSPIVSNTPQK